MVDKNICNELADCARNITLFLILLFQLSSAMNREVQQLYMLQDNIYSSVVGERERFVYLISDKEC